jgi:SAM-dependent methyltransferase
MSGPSSSSRRYGRGVAALPPDYDSDPGRSQSFQLGWQEDVHGPVAERLIARGTRSVVDVGCGIGRFGAALDGRIGWIGVDNSAKQLRDCLRRPVVRADAALLPLPDGSVDAAVLLWMLYHLDDALAALNEAKRVLRSGGILAACAASRWNDPELVPAGYPPTTFDAEDAEELVAEVFGAANIEVERWDEPMVTLRDREEIVAYARSHLLPADVAARVSSPLTLTKRGCLVWATRT